jgi:acyl transferase domain-containing protein/NADP-dependent 3-hydroxy acid dehydrogenase YdfG/acyl carrier protein
MTTSSDHIAVIGMSCRFPGAVNVDEFWANLENGVESVTRFTEQELLELGIEPRLVRDPLYVRARPRLTRPEAFDHEHFGYSAREAEWIDPQQRVFLECSWEALEQAGYDPGAYPGWIAVFAGASFNYYALQHLKITREQFEEPGGFELMIASDKDYVASRVAYKLNLKGPAVTIQTACSTSLVAVHQACQSLLLGECDMALAGGVSIDFPGAGYLYEPDGVRSPDGRCRPFDSEAKGCLFGDGAGVVLLKRLDDAERDGDPIHAVLLGTVANNDGSAKVGFSAPSLEGQARVVATVQRAAGVTPDTISYVEAHGTATPIGDPIEVAALTKAFRRHTERVGFCALGSVKGNVGHLGTAAGIASLIKVVQMLRHRQIPATLHYRRANPKIDFGSTPFYVNDELRDWVRGDTPRRAGVSAFGIGGTNAHAIVEEAPARPERPPELERDQLLVLSARTESALQAVRRGLVEHLRTHPELRLEDVAHTLQVGRRAFPRRATVVCRDLGEAAQMLEAASEVAMPAASVAPRLVFLFTGQGAQYPGIGRELYEREPAFRDALDRCTDTLRSLVGQDLRDVLLPRDPSDGARRVAHEALRRMDVAQPALFSVQYALASLLTSWGIEPAMVFGHSLGEIAAACVAGVLTLDQALELAARRGARMQAQPPGRMLSVPLDADELRPTLPADVHIAVVNGPGMCVVSGADAAVRRYEAELERRGLEPKLLNIPRAAHSPMMAPAADELAKLLSPWTLGAPTKPFLSSLKGEFLSAETVSSPDYWAEHVLRPVLFSKAIARLDPERDFVVEIGAGRGLCTLLELHGPAWYGRATPTLPGPKESIDSQRSLLSTVGKLWQAGVALDWSRPFGAAAGRRVPLPTYPFERSVRSAKPAPRSTPSVASDAGTTNHADARPFERWFSAPSLRVSVASAPSAARTRGDWLILLAAGDGFASRLAEGIRGAGERAVMAVVSSPSSSTGAPLAEEVDNDLWKVSGDAGVPALFEQLRDAGFGCDCVVDCRMLSEVSPGRYDGLPGLAGMIAIAKGLSLLPPRSRILSVLSTGVYAESGGPSPERAALFAAVQSLGYEVPGLVVRAIDLDPFPREPGTPQLAERVIAELTSGSSEPRLCLRRSRRLVPGLDPLVLGPPAENARLSPGQVYLITGGLSGIGWALAQHLAERYRAKLVLVGRSPFPPREEWPAYVRDPRARASVAEKILRLEELSRNGAEVLVLQADVSRREDVARVLEVATRRFGAVHGTFHAAGIASEGLIADKDDAAITAVLGPKVDGTRHLAELLPACGGRFLMLFSSTIALFGGPGQVDYAAANQYLGAFSEASEGNPIDVLTVFWGAWKHTGIAARRKLTQLGELSAARSWQGKGLHPLLESERRDRACRVFIKPLSLFHDWVLSEHRFDDDGVVPGTAYVSAAHAALGRAHPTASAIELRHLRFVTPCRVRDEATVTLELELEPVNGGSRYALRFFRAEEGCERELVAEGEGGPSDENESPSRAGLDFAEFKKRAIAAGSERLFERVNQSGIVRWGPRWRCLRELYIDGAEALGRLELDDRFSEDLSSYAVHPALLDVATALGAAFGEDRVYLPASYERLVFRAPLGKTVYSHVRRRAEASSSEQVFDVTLTDEDGRVAAEIAGYRLVRGPVPRRHDDADAITPEQGIQAIERILATTGLTQVVVSPRELGAELSAQRPLALAFATGTEAVSGMDDATDGTEQRVTKIWRDLLGLESVDLEASFFELGGHSLMALQLQASLFRAFGLHVSMRDFFGTPTLRGLIALLADKHGA